MNYHEKFDNLIFAIQKGVTDIITELKAGKAQAAQEIKAGHISTPQGIYRELRGRIEALEFKIDKKLQKQEADYIRYLCTGHYVDVRSIISITDIENDGYGYYDIYYNTNLSIRIEGKEYYKNMEATLGYFSDDHLKLLEDWKNYRNSL